jgi:hypothetical protein
MSNLSNVPRPPRSHLGSGRDSFTPGTRPLRVGSERQNTRHRGSISRAGPADNPRAHAAKRVQRLTILGPLFVWAGLAATRATLAAGGVATDWEPAHRIEEGTSVDRVWAFDRNQWVAAGADVIVTASERGIRVHRIPGLAVTNVRGTRLGVFAVGSSGSVWRVKGLQIEQQVGPTRRPAATRDPDLIEDVVEGVLDGKRGLLALGSRLAYFSPDGERWQPATGVVVDKQREAVLLGPRPEDCLRSAWLSFDGSADSGLLVCNPRTPARWLAPPPAATTTIEAIPRQCRSPAAASPSSDKRLFVLCRPDSLWQWQRERGWVQVEAPRGVVFIQARSTCLFAVDGTTVWRRCERDQGMRSPSL